MKRFKLFIPLIVFIALAVLFWQGLKMDPTELPSALVGRLVPEFALGTVQDPQQIKTQEDLKGHRYALINVWATWCGPCRIEHPYLVELAKQGVPIYGVNVDEADGLHLTQQWLDERGDPYHFSVFDSERRLALDLGVYGYPETFLIDENGAILLRKVSVLSEQVWQQDFKPLIDALPE